MTITDSDKKKSSGLTKKQILKKKAKDIKEKLSGKNYSPIVAKVKGSQVLSKKKVISPASKNGRKAANKDTSKILTRQLSAAAEKSSESTVVISQNKTEAKPKAKAKKAEVNPIKRKIEIIDTTVSQAGKKRKPNPKINSALPGLNLVSTQKKNKNPRHKNEGEDAAALNDSNSTSQEIPEIILPKLSRRSERGSKSITKDPGHCVRIKPLSDRESVSKDDLIEDEESSADYSSQLTLKKGKKSVLKPIKVKTLKKNPALEDLVEPEEKVNDESPGSLIKKKLKKGKKIGQGVLRPAKNIKSLAKKPALKEKALKRGPRFPERGVCVFKNIPHGFYEKEIKKYCTQFGTVTGVYHPVSKSGNSRGYAFVEFAHKDVAEVVAKTMNNYVMFYKRMQCEFVPKDQERPWVFRHKKTNEDLARERREKALKQRMRRLSNAETTAWEKRKQSRVNALHKKLSALGVDYQFKVTDSVKTA